MKKVIFSSGLPRAGTTLLCNILNQNPRFEAHITNHLYAATSGVIEGMNQPGLNRTYDLEEKTRKIVKSIIDNFHDTPDKDVFFNHNRVWTTKLSMLKDLNPDFRMIVCVRDIGWVLDSFEVLLEKNPYVLASFFNNKERSNVFMRYHALMDEFNGVVGASIAGIKQAIYSPYVDNLIFIDYDSLAQYPYENMKSIYSFIDEPYFEHDFKNVESAFDEFDIELNMPGMHKVRREITLTKRQSILPKDIWSRVHGMEVWKNVQGLNHGFTGNR